MPGVIGSEHRPLLIIVIRVDSHAENDLPLVIAAACPPAFAIAIAVEIGQQQTHDETGQDHHDHDFGETKAGTSNLRGIHAVNLPPPTSVDVWQSA